MTYPTDRIDIGEGLRRAAAINKVDKTALWIPEALRLALDACVNANLLIEEETAPLRLLREEVEPELQPDVDYQIWLIEQQLLRAAEEARRRAALIASIQTQADIDAEMLKCFKGDDPTVYWFRNWAWTFDPREDASISVLPFKPFEFQEDLIRRIDRSVFLERSSLVIVKTRDMGVSWVACDWAVHKYLNPYKSSQGLLGSRVEPLVDSIGEMDSLFEKIRFQLRLLPTWMLPKGFEWKRDVNWCRILNPETKSTIGGESSNENFGRGGRYTYVLPDEYAAFPYGGFQAWTGMQQSSKSKIVISTPKGMSNKFSELYHSGTIKTSTLHWMKHPWKTEAWYEAQKRELNATEIGQELDCDFEASQPGQVFPQWKELSHIISAEEFIEFYGEEALDRFGNFRIPLEWNLGMAMDIGYTEQHRWVIEWFATPSEGYELSDACYLYRTFIVPIGWTARQVARKIFELEAPNKEHLRMTMRLQSHEAVGELLTFGQEHALSFSQWDTAQGYNFGIPQFQNYLEVRRNYKHPFKQLVHGRARFYAIAQHSDTYLNTETGKYEVRAPQKECKIHSYDCDHSLFRKEMPRYHFPESEKGKAVAAMRPFKADDDSVDPARAIMAQFCPPVNHLQDSVKRAKSLPKNVQNEYIRQQTDPEYKARLAMTRDFIEMERQLGREPEDSDWREQLRRG